AGDFPRALAAPNSQCDRIRFDCRLAGEGISSAPRRLSADAKGVAFMGPTSSRPDAVDLPDPWDTSTGDTVPGAPGSDRETEELISRLAGDDVQSLMGGRGLPQPPRPGPVQQLTSQLDD